MPHTKNHKNLRFYNKKWAMMGALAVTGVFFLVPPVNRTVYNLIFFNTPSKNVQNKFSFYVGIPEILINLYTPNEKRNMFLKLSAVIEINTQEESEIVTRMMPKIVDEFQLYLRELRPLDLKGAEGVLLLKEQLTARVHKHVEGFKIKNILLKDMLVQ